MDELAEGLLDVVASLGGGFFEAEVVLYTEVHYFLFGDGPGFLSRLDQVQLIGDDDFRHLVLDFLFDVSQPHAQVFKALLVSDVEHDDGSVALAVVGPGDRHVLLCSRCLSTPLHVSQMFTRTSLEPTFKFTGAYSTPMVGVRLFSPTPFLITQFRKEVFPTLQFPIKITT